MALDKIPPGPKLDGLTTEKVFSWKKVQKHVSPSTVKVCGFCLMESVPTSSWNRLTKKQ
jgi:hypothetical protein